MPRSSCQITFTSSSRLRRRFRLKSKMDVWMRSFNESQIMTPEKFVSCVKYIEENPVRARLVEQAEDYAYTSAGRDPLDPVPEHLRG